MAHRNSRLFVALSSMLMAGTIAAMPAAAQKFHLDDPIRMDDDAAVNVTRIKQHKLSDYYDLLQHTFGSPADLSRVRALNVNTLGEVPDSSWFQNRHGAVRRSPEALVRGPNSGDGPSLEAPWLVVDAKTEGVTPGFRIRDARGDTYLIKFDPTGNPELATAAEVISTKFFHAIGYNVPENYVAYFKRSQLRVDKEGRMTDVRGRRRALTNADLDEILKRVHRSPDGTYRAVASKFLQGRPAGPFQYYGTRPDDPNDVFPHEHRRELRGLRVFAAWLNHDDSRAINTLDMLVDEGGKQHLKHYLIDFGSTLGSASIGPQKPRAGWEYMWEPLPALGRIASLGLWDRKWVHVRYPDHPSIGRFESASFEPENWKPEYPNPAFLNATKEDAYWAAKIVMAFTDQDIQAIVRTGGLSDPTAENYLIRTLIERRDKIGRRWLTGVSSFDEFSLTDNGLEFDHLASHYGFAPRPDHHVAWYQFDNESGHRSPARMHPRSDTEGYFVAEITSVEGKVNVYVRTMHGLEIIGVER